LFYRLNIDTHSIDFRIGNFCSFLRRAKVEVWGRGLLAAVEERYGAVEGDTAGVEEGGMRELQHEIGARFVEVVGFDKVNREQSDVASLRTVSVSSLGVRGRWALGEEKGDLDAHLPSLRDLDLSQTLVSSWEEIAKLAVELHLEVLDLSSNLIPVPCQPLPLTYPRLKHLVLGRMLYSGYTWSQVLLLTSNMPCLTILQLHGNNLTSLSQLSDGTFQSLEELDLDDNQLSDGTEVEVLGRLANLTHLRLNCNRLDIIAPGPNSFPSLRTLQLSGNLISSFTSVGALDNLKLSELRLRSNPVNRSAKDEETVRQLVIARVSSLTSLNGSIVTETERKWAEIDYLKTHGAEYLALADIEDEKKRCEARDAFMAAHNRYEEVVRKHGEPQKGEGVVVDTTLKSSLMKLKVRSPDLIGSAETVKKVPSSMTVAKLRALLRRVYKKTAGSAPLDLFLLGQESQTEVRLDNDLRELSFYSVCEGDTLLVRWSAATETDL